LSTLLENHSDPIVVRRFSSISSKACMAATGIALSGFVLVHLLGNLLIYFGSDALNFYAHSMQTNTGLLWTARIGLLVVFLSHIALAIQLQIQNKASRPVGYKCQGTVEASLASRTMIYSGIMIFFFVCYHLAHFTLHWIHDTNPGLDAKGRLDVYSMLITGFRQPLISSIYLLAMFSVAFHLRHGVSSLFQSLGLNHDKYSGLLLKIGVGFSAFIFLGNISIPLLVFLGCIGGGGS